MSRLAISRRASIAAIAAVTIQATLSVAAIADPSTSRSAEASSGEISIATSPIATRRSTLVHDPASITATAVKMSERRNAAVAATFETSSATAARERHGVQGRASALRANVFATVEGLDLHLTGKDVRVIGFHEAGEQHLALSPRGVATANFNDEATPMTDDQGHPYVIMPSRDREGAPTSAVDLVMPRGAKVLAPVSGTVLSVADYLLYDEYEDTQIQIVPDGRPDLIVTMYHVQGSRVHVGQRLTAGETTVADAAREFDFIAQVEQWGLGPHVDLRVHRA